jgi:hypothetical protein
MAGLSAPIRLAGLLAAGGHVSETQWITAIIHESAFLRDEFRPLGGARADTP